MREIINMTFAVINTGGKQYKVSTNDKLRIEKLSDKEGESVIFKQVLLINNNDNMELGSPLIEGAKVEAKVIKQTKNKTILIFKKRRRHNSRRLNGHKRMLTIVRINEILLEGKSLAKYKESAKKKVYQSNNKKTKDKDEKRKKDLKGAKDGN